MMATTRNRRRIMLMLSLLALAIVVVLLSFGGIENNLVYYLSPKELLEKDRAAYGATVRLGGVVQKGSVHWNTHTMDLTFALGMADEGDPKVMVHARGAPPQMFQESMGAVVEGQFDGRTFEGDRVMVKHSNEYRPPSPDESPAKAFRTLDAPEPKPAVEP